MTTANQKISSFVRIDPNEVFERDYYITHTSLRRITLGRVFKVFALLVLTFICGSPLLFAARKIALIILVAILLFVPAVLLGVYYVVRRLRISHGYAAVTNRRLMYYEYNDHPAENYQLVKSVHLDDVTAIDFRLERAWWFRSFSMVVYTSERGMMVGARGFMGFFKWFGGEKKLEPGPDALEFVQDMTGAIAARKFLPQSGSSRMI